MSWRAGSKLFIEVWPAIQANIPDRGHRIAFTGRLLQLLADGDMDSWDVEDVHPDVRAAMRQAGIDIAEPQRYPDDATAETPTADAAAESALESRIGETPEMPAGPVEVVNVASVLAAAVVGFVLGVVTAVIVVLLVLALR